MAHNLPTTMKQWVLRDKSGFENLLLEESPLPEIGDFEVLIKVHAVSLNYRDLMIAQVVLHARRLLLSSDVYTREHTTGHSNPP